MPHRAHLLSGDWHMHTRFTDGMSTVRECCAAARAQGLTLVAVTEHVRRELRYDCGAFVAEVEAARREFPELVILHGCEAKVLNEDGELDASDDVLARCDVVLGAFHAFPSGARWLTAALNMLANPQVDVWAHPTLYCRKHGVELGAADVERLVAACREEQVLVEMNGRYRLPSGAFLEAVAAAGVECVRGSDAHHASEVGRWWTGTALVSPNGAKEHHA
jgi:histidinol phosphatase-like PHP family hydrolase